MLGRRGFLVGVGLGIVVPSSATASSPKTVRLAILRGGPDDEIFRENFGPFVRTLQTSGFVAGTNLTLDYRVRPGGVEDFKSLTQSVVNEGVDAILAIGPVAVRGAARTTTSIPIVAVDLETDPIAERFVTSLGRPGRNLTGLFLDFPSLSGKWIEILREAVPRLTRIAVLWDPTSGDTLVRGARTAARQLNVHIAVFEVPNPDALPAAFDGAAQQRTGGMVVLPSPVTNSARVRVAELATRHRMPVIMAFSGFVRQGGLIAYGPDLQTMFGQAGEVMVRVLRGQRPAEIPLARPARFTLSINGKTAKSLGLALPPSLLLRADDIVD